MAKKALITLVTDHGPLTVAELSRKSRRTPGQVRVRANAFVRDGQLLRYENGILRFGCVTKPKIGKPDVLYTTVLADPPWPYRDQTCRGAARRHYQVMTVDQIAALPIKHRVTPNAHLYLWITKDMFMDAAHLPILEAWGFRHITRITWVKAKAFKKRVMCPCGCKHRFWVEDEKGRTLQMGLGRYFRGVQEELIFAVRGRAPIPPSIRMVDLFFHPRTPKHSRKPEVFRERIEKVSKGRYLEIFGETRRSGWDRWGKSRKP